MLPVDLSCLIHKTRQQAFEELAIAFETAQMCKAFTPRQIARIVRDYARRHPEPVLVAEEDEKSP